MPEEKDINKTEEKTEEKPKRRIKKSAGTAPAKKKEDKAAEKKISAVEQEKAPAARKVVPKRSEFKSVAKPSVEEKPKKPDRYFEAVGRRKTAIARVRLFTKPGDFTVNDKHYSTYFMTPSLQKVAEDALQKMKLSGRFRVSAKTKGGGLNAQAEAVRHGLARCLTKFNPDFRKRLKRAGFLMRDPRAKERKKFGLKKARRAPQWAKR